LLTVIRDRKPQSVAEQVQMTGRAQPNLTRTLAKLEAAGFVRMTPHGRRKTPSVAVKRIIVVITVVVIVTWRKERERTEALRRVAMMAGLAFEPKADIDAVRSLGDVQLFSRGHSRRVANLMTGRLDGQQLAVFDYWYTTGSGKSQRSSAQTVVLQPPRGLAGARHTQRTAASVGKWRFEPVGWCRMAVRCGLRKGGNSAYAPGFGPVFSFSSRARKISR
jgi:hypothetical protein